MKAAIKSIDSDVNLKLELELIEQGSDIEPGRSNVENYIPYNFKFQAGEEIFTMGQELMPTMTVYEAYRFVIDLEGILMPGAQNLRTCYDSSEAFFSLYSELVPEDSCVEMELWINMGTLTSGEIFGYDKGYRFVVSVEDFSKFAKDIRSVLENLKQKNGFADFIPYVNQQSDSQSTKS